MKLQAILFGVLFLFAAVLAVFADDDNAASDGDDAPPSNPNSAAPFAPGQEKDAPAPPTGAAAHISPNLATLVMTLAVLVIFAASYVLAQEEGNGADDSAPNPNSAAPFAPGQEKKEAPAKGDAAHLAGSALTIIAGTIVGYIFA